MASATEIAARTYLTKVTRHARSTLADIECERQFAWDQRRDAAVERSIYAAHMILCALNIGWPEDARDELVRAAMKLAYDDFEP